VDIHLPFLDGALAYDCARCGAKCCKGHGFGMRGDELVPLLARRPAVAPFIHFAGGHVNALDLTDDGCWMLRPDGRCAIEIDDGRAAKPTVCKLFPFTRAYRVGEAVIVEPHLLLCPLEDARGAGVRHADVLSDIMAMGAELPLLARSLPGGLPDAWLDRERAALSLTATHLDDASPLPLQIALAGKPLDNLWNAWRASFALDDLDDHARAIVRPLALLTPALRMNLLFGNTGLPYPRLIGRLPGQLLVTALVGSLAVRALGRPLASLRSLGELFSTSLPLRELLPRWLDAVTIDIDSLPPPTILPPEVASAFVKLIDSLRDAPRPLGEAFDDAARPLPPHLRFPLARAFAPLAHTLRLG
jgi:hypothetical protein